MRTGVVLLMAIVVMCVLPFVAAAGLYRWVDENGISHITDAPPSTGGVIEETMTGDAPSPGVLPQPGNDAGQQQGINQGHDEFQGTAADSGNEDSHDRLDRTLR